MSSKHDTALHMGRLGVLRVPLDIWEAILDHCHLYYPLYRGNYETLQACALVCSAWLPGSRRNLLREVRLGTSDQLDLLLRLFAEKPKLGELVMAIRVLDNDYVPFARSPLPQLVPNCRSLFVDVSWITIYPPSYPKFISEYRGLKALLLRIAGLSAEDVLHIIWSLPLLSSLTLLDWDLTGGSGSERGEDGLDKHTEICHNLKQLIIKSPTPSSVLCRQNFLPRGCFGHSITQLELIVRGDMTISQSFLECISDFRQLRTLDITTTIYETSETHKPSDILSLALQVLPHIQPGPQLRELRLQLNPMIDLHRSQKLERTYGITRFGFLNILRGAEIQKRFPSLDLFFLWLWEHRDADCAQQWWTEQILDRLPALQNVLQVQLMETLGQGDVPFLWDPDGLAQIRGS